MSTNPNPENSEDYPQPPVVLPSKNSAGKAFDGSCSACGCVFHTQRIWCPQCATPLVMDRQALPVDESMEKTLEDRAELYRAILADQDQLLSQQHVSSKQIRPIRLFYDQRLREVLGDLADLRNQRELSKLVENVVSVAQSGQLEQALQRLTQELKKRPDEADLKALHEEIGARHRRIQADLQTKKRTEEIFAAAKMLIQKQDYEEASNALQSARKLQPNNESIEECFQQVEQLLREEREKEEQSAERHAPLRIVEPAENEEPITASIVSPNPSPPDKPLTSSLGQTHFDDETTSPSTKGKPAAYESEVHEPTGQLRAAPSFADEEEVPTAAHRHIEALSSWTNLIKPFLMDNVGWFVGAFLVIAGFVVLIVTFWNTIEQNQILMHSLVFASLFLATGVFFAAAYFMRLRYPQLESSSDVLLVIVALLIPLVFAAAILTALIPATQTGGSLVQVEQVVEL